MLEFTEPPPKPKRPNLPGTVVLRETMDDVLDAAAADLLVQANNCVRAFGDFHLAVSVCEETVPLLRRAMYDLNLRDLPWKRTHLWITDERASGPDDEQSRFALLRDLVVDQSDIPREQTHAIPALSAEPDRKYEAELRETLAWREKGHDRLDYVLLGLRDDGSVAGLYPGGPGSVEDDRLAMLTGQSDEPAAGEAASAVTLTPAMINAARLIAVMATGAERRSVLTTMAQRRGPSGSSNPVTVPAMRLAPLAGELRWYLDHEAAPA